MTIRKYKCMYRDAVTGDDASIVLEGYDAGHIEVRFRLTHSDTYRARDHFSGQPTGPVAQRYRLLDILPVAEALCPHDAALSTCPICIGYTSA